MLPSKMQIELFVVVCIAWTLLTLKLPAYIMEMTKWGHL